MARVHRLDAARQVAARALASGGQQTSLSTFSWDISGPCQSPVVVAIEGRPDTRKGEVGLPIEVSMETRCRRCAACLRHRGRLWRVRSLAEVAASYRTWFGTLTLKPEEHYLAELRASAELRRRGTRLEELSPEEQFMARHSAISRDLTLWLKRIRKDSGAKLRYILVAEAHKSGLPHYHCLVHEVENGKMVSKRCLEKHWGLGFSNWRVVTDPKAAHYVTKYLQKSAIARVRASLRYGIDALSLDERKLLGVE